MGLFKKDPFGHYLFIKKFLIRVLGALTHRRYRGFNELKIEGSEVITNLPDRNVLFISNHQTYFADVVAMYHVFNASLHGRIDSIKNIGYLWNPKLNIYYVAAEETMKAGLYTRVMAYGGAVTIERTWRKDGHDINRRVRISDITNIGKALEDGWVITFPQGTTTPWKPIRKGTAHIVKKYKPIVVPVVIDGFRRSFDKKGIRMKKKGILQSMVIKEPLEIDYENESVQSIVEKMEYAIEQHSSFLKVIPLKELKLQEKLNEMRRYSYKEGQELDLEDESPATEKGKGKEEEE